MPFLVIRIFRFVIALGFIIYTLSHRYNALVGWSFGLIIFIAIVFVFGQSVRTRAKTIESKFLNNLNERDLRRSGRNNNVVSDIHLAYVKAGYDSQFIGLKIADSHLRDTYGTNIMSIQRGSHVIYVPSSSIRIFPGDILGIVGTDEQLQTVIPLIEAGIEDQEESDMHADVRLLNVDLKPGSPLIGKNVVTSCLGKTYSALLVSVQRQDNFLPPTPQTVFAPGDILWMYGLPSLVSSLKG